MWYNQCMKNCARCGDRKPLDEFNKSSKNSDGRHSWCRTCSKGRYVETRDKHLANVKRNNAAYTAKARTLVKEALSSGCVDCQNKDIRVLDFDHVRGDKVSGVMLMIRKGQTLEKIKSEISKCDVRCRNCHAIATYGRMQNCWRNS